MEFSPTYSVTLPPTTDADVRKKREKEGRCATCGAQTHEIKRTGFLGRRREKLPLVIEGEVLRGRCLRCHPIQVQAYAAAVPAQPTAVHAQGSSASPLRVVVGSTSEIKRGAVEDALSGRPGGEIEVRGVKTTSGVPPQPRGRDETRRGAANRALGARRASPDAAVWIGIQNGVYENDAGALVDAACVVCYSADHTCHDGVREISCFWSDELAVPTDGSMRPGPNGEWSELKDPHAVLTGGRRPRRAFIADAVRRALDRGELVLPGHPYELCEKHS